MVMHLLFLAIDLGQCLQRRLLHLELRHCQEQRMNLYRGIEQSHEQ